MYTTTFIMMHKARIGNTIMCSSVGAFALERCSVNVLTFGFLVFCYTCISERCNRSIPFAFWTWWRTNVFFSFCKVERCECVTHLYVFHQGNVSLWVLYVFIQCSTVEFVSISDFGWGLSSSLLGGNSHLVELWGHARGSIWARTQANAPLGQSASANSKPARLWIHW